MILSESNTNLENWTNHEAAIMDDSAGNSFTAQDPTGDQDWVNTDPGSRHQSPSRLQGMAHMASPNPHYLNQMHDAGENRFAHHHGYGTYYNAGVGPSDAALDSRHPNNMEDDSKPSAVAHRMHSPMPPKPPPVHQRHSLSHDPFVGIDAGFSLEEDDLEREPGRAEKRARLLDTGVTLDARDIHNTDHHQHPHQFHAWSGSSYDPTLAAVAYGQPQVAAFHFDDALTAQYPAAVRGSHPGGPPHPGAPPPPPPHVAAAAAALAAPTVHLAPRRSTRRASPKTKIIVKAPAAAPAAARAPARASTQAAATQSGANPPAAANNQVQQQQQQHRFLPTPQELAQATTARGVSAVHVWYERLQDLDTYKQHHGHVNVPQKYTGNQSLGIWVNKQRMEKKAWDDGLNSSMTAQKIAALERIGFVWAKRKGQASWNQKHHELVEYHSQHGDCNVPTKYVENPALGRWVSTQRSQYKQFLRSEKTHMTAERFQKLDDLSFKWNMMGEASSPASDGD